MKGLPLPGMCDTAALVRRAARLKHQAGRHIEECEDAMDRYRQEQQVLALLIEAARRHPE